MNIITKTTLALALAAGTALAAPEVGQPAPAVTLTDSNGQFHNLADFKGKFVVLEWLNHGCPFVVKHYGNGNMQGLQKEFTGKDVVWLSIVSSAPGKQGHMSPEEANKAKKAAGPDKTEPAQAPTGDKPVQDGKEAKKDDKPAGETPKETPKADPPKAPAREVR